MQTYYRAIVIFVLSSHTLWMESVFYFFFFFFYLIHKIVVSSLGWSRLIEQTIDFLFIFIYSFFFSQLQSQSIGISLHRSSFSCYQSIYKGAQFFFYPRRLTSVCWVVFCCFILLPQRETVVFINDSILFIYFFSLWISISINVWRNRFCLNSRCLTQSFLRFFYSISFNIPDEKKEISYVRTYSNRIAVA